MWEGVRDLAAATGSLADARVAARRSVRAILAGVLVVTGLAAALVASHTPSYVATVSLLVRPPPDPSDQPQRALLLEGFTSDSAEMQNQIAILQSEQLLRDVFETLGERSTDARSFAAFAAGVSARRVGLSNVIELTDRNDDPVLAARDANAVAAGFLLSRIDSAAEAASLRHPDARVSVIRNHAVAAEAATREGVSPMDVLVGADALVLTAALPPEAPIAPRRGPALVFGALVGAFLPLVFALFRNTADPTIRAARHIVEGLGTTCLARVGRRDGAGTLVAALVPVAHRLKSPVFDRERPIVVLAPFGLAEAAAPLAAALTVLLASSGRITDIPVVSSSDQLTAGDLVVVALPEGEVRVSRGRRFARMLSRTQVVILGAVLVGDPPRAAPQEAPWRPRLPTAAPPRRA